MHVEAMSYVAQVVAKRGPFATVIDAGGRDINGSPRALFPGAVYTSVDLVAGPGVDVVADARHWQPPGPVEAVLVLEVLEHAEAAHELVDAAVSWLAPGGVLIVTAACDPRAPHSAVDGGPIKTGEYYGNVDPGLLRAWMADLDEVTVEVHGRGDVYGVGVRT